MGPELFEPEEGNELDQTKLQEILKLCEQLEHGVPERHAEVKDLRAQLKRAIDRFDELLRTRTSVPNAPNH